MKTLPFLTFWIVFMIIAVTPHFILRYQKHVDEMAAIELYQFNLDWNPNKIAIIPHGEEVIGYSFGTNLKTGEKDYGYTTDVPALKITRMYNTDMYGNILSIRSANWSTCKPDSFVCVPY